MSFLKVGGAVAHGTAIMSLILTGTIYSQTHFTFTSNTGNNMTVAIQTSINPTVDGAAIAIGDEIGVFNGESCVGAGVWTGTNSAVTVWGDNDQTPAIDGATSGDTLKYRVWRVSTAKEVPAAVTYSLGGPTYSVNGIAVLARLTAVSLSKPTISPKTQTITVPAGGTVSVAFTVTGNPAPSFQWYRNGTILSGATDPAVFPVASPAPADSGNYSLVTSNSQGADTARLELMVLFAPAITIQPLAQTKYVGDSVIFSVVASGNPAPTYQWSKNDTAITSAVSARYKMTAAALTDSGIYAVLVTNSQGHVTSTGVKLMVLIKPAITITSPNGTEKLYLAQKFTVTWTTQGSIDSVKIAFSSDSGASWIALVSKTVNDGTESVTMPNLLSSKCLVRVSSVKDSTVRDMSNGVFSLAAPTSAEESGLASIKKFALRGACSAGKVQVMFDVPSITGRDLHDVTIDLFDIGGRLVRRIASGQYLTGHHAVIWNGSMRPGLYIMQMKSESFDGKVKLTMMK